MIAWFRRFLPRPRQGSVSLEQRRRAAAIAAQDRVWIAAWDAEVAREARREARR
jgi:hypothetical protein